MKLLLTFATETAKAGIVDLMYCKSTEAYVPFIAEHSSVFKISNPWRTWIITNTSSVMRTYIFTRAPPYCLYAGHLGTSGCVFYLACYHVVAMCCDSKLTGL